jgi:hypothetical protein
MCRGDGTEQFDGPSTFTAKVTWSNGNPTSSTSTVHYKRSIFALKVKSRNMVL